MPLIEQKQLKKWTRLILRELYDLGYTTTAKTLEHEAGLALQSPAMKRMHHYITHHQWDQAVQFLLTNPNQQDPEKTLKMKSVEATRQAALLLLKRKYLDFLVSDQLTLALRTFQEEIRPISDPTETEVMELAELLLCSHTEDKTSIAWLQDTELGRMMEELVSPEEIIPEGALRRLMLDGLETDIVMPRPLLHGEIITGECIEILTSDSKLDMWEVAFSPDGEILASASSDGSIVLWQMKWLGRMRNCRQQLQCEGHTLHVLQSHDQSADCLVWSPDSRSLLSSGNQSGMIQLWDPMSGSCKQRFQHPEGMVTKVRWLPCGDQFLSGSADKSLVLWNASDGSIVYQWSGRRVLDIVVQPNDSKVFVLTSGHEIRVYDMTVKSDELFFQAEHLVSCLSISPSGEFLLVNFVKQEQIACVKIATGSVIAKYCGFREQRYVLRPCFGGNHSELVIAGSEDGMVYLWQRDSGKHVGKLEGHSSVVNVVVRHPIHSNVIASASDDKTVRLWSLQSLE